MVGFRSFVIAAGTLLLAACAVTPLPTRPAVLALPAKGRPLAQFQAEDASCRHYATTRIGPTASASAGELQQRYDTAYAQCMTAAGDSVAPPPGYYDDYYWGPAYYDDPWDGPFVGVGFEGFGHGFHHHGFHHHGFHHHGFVPPVGGFHHH
jgi:hypothetical protein